MSEIEELKFIEDQPLPEALEYDSIYGAPNIAYGANTGVLLNVDAWSNLMAGKRAGAGLVPGGGYVGGSNNVFVGNFAGLKTTSGANNTFVGMSAGYMNSQGSDSVYIGETTGWGMERNYTMYNTFIGTAAGQNYAGSTGTLNTFIGGLAGINLDGDENVCLGYASGLNCLTGDSNVFLGTRAGYNETGSNKLYIENSTSRSALVYGEFDNDYLELNANVYCRSAFSLKDGIGEPDAVLGHALIYIDEADGDLKIKFGDGFVRVLGADS